ncbi:MAG TPA: hypothetical protein VMG30_19465 [Acidobacteriota bacterium]|nr:hypothetical protein [Acidobacteriota bacterium]
MIPYVLHRDEVINMLMDDPDRFEKLVQAELADKTEYSKSDLTVKLDAAAELGKLDAIEALDQSLWGDSEINLDPILELVNQLTRTFAVYAGNAATLFDKAFEEFMDKFRQSMQRAGMTIQAIDFTSEDSALLESSAMSYISQGEFLQAFTYERLLTSQTMIKQVVNLPPEGFSLRSDLIRYALHDENLCVPLVKFMIRVSYISHGVWEDLFMTLVRQMDEEPSSCGIAKLIDLIEQDVVFSCNLICKSYAEIREWTPEQRRLAIENGLKASREKRDVFRPV